MSMYPHRGMGGVPPGGNGASRLNELLDNIRSEFETQVRQCENYEHQSEHALTLRRWNTAAPSQRNLSSPTV